MSALTDTDRRTDELTIGELAGEMSPEEFIDKLAESLGLLHEDTLQAVITGETSVEELAAGGRLERYGTGTQAQPALDRRSLDGTADPAVEELVAQMEGTNDPDAYGTGVLGDSSPEERVELLADAIELARERRAGEED